MVGIPLAYKYVALAVMMAEINFCAGKLHLKDNLPIDRQHVIHELIVNPHDLGFGGRLDTKNYSYTFGENGHLKFITKLEDGRYQSMGLYRGGLSMRDFMEQLSVVKSTIDTNEAYHIATNWLAVMEVDFAKLQKDESLKVEQQLVQSSKRGLVPVPLFYVKWGMKVDILINGINGDLLNLRQEDDSYSKRPLSLVKDMDKLLAIPDSDFLKYSDLERSNLVVRFSAVAYPGPTNALLHAVEANNVITTNPTFPIIKNFAPTAVPPP